MNNNNDATALVTIRIDRDTINAVHTMLNAMNSEDTPTTDLEQLWEAMEGHTIDLTDMLDLHYEEAFKYKATIATMAMLKVANELKDNGNKDS